MQLQDLSKDGILEALGLQARRTALESILPALGIFAAGLLAGAGVALMFAPKAGSELRREIGEKFHSARDRMRDGVASATRDADVV